MNDENYESEIIFNESKVQYASSILYFIIGLIVVVSFNYLIGKILLSIITLLITIYLFQLCLKSQYNWSMDNKYHIIPMLILGLFIYLLQEINFIFVFASILISLPLIIGIILPLSSYTYTMKLNYNLFNEKLSIGYDKLFLKINEEYYIPKNIPMKLCSSKPKFPWLFFRKGLFHSIFINQNDQIYIAPMNVNGFSLVNKLIQLLQPSNLTIDTITKTNAKLVMPQPKNTVLTVPKIGIPDPYYAIEIIDKLTKKSSFKSLSPKYGKFTKLKPSIIIIFIFLIIIIASGFILVIISDLISGTIELSSSSISSIVILNMLIPSTVLLLLMNLVILSNVFTVWFGEFDIDLNDEFVNLYYNFKNMKKVELNIHKSLNPLIELDGNIIFLIILSDNNKIFYKHRIGSVSNKDLSMITNNT